MGWRREDGATLDDIAELLAGLGRMLLEITARLDDIVELLEERS